MASSSSRLPRLLPDELGAERRRPALKEGAGTHKVAEMPRTSFLIPVRDGGRYIVAALESALAQTDPDLEVVVVDDGSSDDTAALVEGVQTRDARVRLLRLTRGSGLVDALNFGLEQARGDFVARLDADDLAMPDRLEQQLSFLDANPGVAVVGSALDLVDGRGTHVGRVDHPTEPGTVRLRLIQGNVLAHSAVVIRRDRLDATCSYRRTFAHAEDYDLWLRIADSHDLANVAEPLTRYRIHADQVSATHIEEQAVSALAARTVARIRRDTGREPDLPSTADMAFLLRMGLTNETVAQAIAQAALEWSSMVEKVDRRRAATLLASVSRRLRSGSTHPVELDRRAIRYALQGGRPDRAIAPLLRQLGRRLS
jgi:glycosyltransferase involved in cell wall biosynthesis